MVLLETSMPIHSVGSFVGYLAPREEHIAP